MSVLDTELVAKAERNLIEAFRGHWRRIVIRHLDGESFTDERGAAFLAGSPGARRYLAEWFFGYPHACSLAILSDGEVRQSLQPWLRHAAEHAARNLDPDDREWAAELSALIHAPYVTVVEPLGHGDPLVMSYPGTSNAAYDDLYERTAAGCSVGARLFVYWSTGEPFGYNERRSTRAGIRNDFLAGAADAGDDEDWEIDFEDHDDHAVIAHICERMVDDESD